MTDQETEWKRFLVRNGLPEFPLPDDELYEKALDMEARGYKFKANPKNPNSIDAYKLVDL